jgi:hypothetical protein
MNGSGESGDLKISQLSVAAEVFGSDIVPIIRQNGSGETYDNYQAAIYLFPQGPEAFSQLIDVSIASPQNGQVPVYNSGAEKWENASLSYVPSFNGRSNLAITLRQGSGITLTELPEGTFTVSASGVTGGGTDYAPVTWANAGGTEVAPGVWEITPPGTGSTNLVLSDIAPTLNVGDTIEVLGAFTPDENQSYITFTPPNTPSGDLAMLIGTSGGLVYFNDGGSTVESAGSVFGAGWVSFRVRGVVISKNSGGVRISWDCEMGGQLIGGADMNGSPYTGPFGLAIGYYQSAGTVATVTLYGWQYRVITGSA